MDIEWWTAAGAVGQWFGAIGTIGAVWIAISNNKSKIKIQLSEKDSFYSSCPPKICLLVINKGRFLVNFIGKGLVINKEEKLKTPLYGSSLPNSDKRQEFDFDAGTLSNELREKGFSGKVLVKFYLINETDELFDRVFYFNVDTKQLIISKYYNILARFYPSFLR